jgi:hypothetical protein
MIDPVSRSIRGERKATYGFSVDLVVELEEDTKASERKGGMRRFGENVIA